MSLKHNFDEPISRINTDSYKWDYEGEGGKYVPLGVADTDFKSPQPVIDVLRDKVDFGIYAYGYLPQQRFTSAVCNWYKKRYNTNVNPNWVKHAQGLMTGALWMLLDAFTRPGDKILLQPPVYNTFKVVIEGAGRVVETNDLILKDSRYEIDFEDLERKVADAKVRIMLICSPHNPVGRVWTRDELVRVYDICKKNDVLIISDEIHMDVVYGDNIHTPFFDINDNIDDHVIVMGGPSKTFNLASFYSAYVIIKNKFLREQYQVIYDNYHFDYNYFGIEALITSYNDCDYYVDQLKEYLVGNINIVKEFIAENMPDVKIIEPESTYLLWIDFSSWNMSQTDLMNFFKDCGVRLNSGSNYGESGNGFVRLNIACPEFTLRKALELIKNGYKELHI